jgi:hypothetical protein
MPEITADKIIGKTLFAKKDLTRLNSSLVKIGTIVKGSPVGQVYSYIQRGGNVYWQFIDFNNKPYFILHTADSFKFSGDVKEAVQQQEKEAEKIEKLEKGSIPFYIEKYGKTILIYGIAAYLIATYIKSKNGK